MLKRAEVDALVVNVTDDLETTKMLIEAGFSRVPVVYIGETPLGGLHELEMVLRGNELGELLKD